MTQYYRKEDIPPELLERFEAVPLEPVPCIVLDIFVGSGTTVEEAIRLRRHGIGLDINAEYLHELATERAAVIQPVML